MEINNLIEIHDGCWERLSFGDVFVYGKLDVSLGKKV